MAGRSSNRVTVKDVAQEAGVSTQTVSRVVNNVQGVLPVTRQRVQETINRLGYRPNVIARSLIQQRSCSLGLVATGIELYGPSSTLVGIEQKANTCGYSLNLSLLLQPETDDVAPLLDGFLSRQVDGIIWATQEIGNNMDWLDDEPLPIPIVFLEIRPRSGVFNVSIDSRYGGQIAVRHLIACGYRKIGVISGPTTWWSARERLQGWRDALTEANLPSDPRQILEGNWSTGSGAQGLELLLTQFPEVEAIFVCNDQMALGVLQTSRKLGRRVPEDLAVIGYDDIPEAAYFWPPLTTVRQDLMTLGGTAVELISRLITSRRDGGDGNAADPETTWLKPELIIRGSSQA
jgi:LacI family transcriptional regulator